LTGAIAWRFIFITLNFVGLIGLRSVFHTVWALATDETVPAYPWMLALSGDFHDGGMRPKID
jgi:hypothetical protein